MRTGRSLPSRLAHYTLWTLAALALILALALAAFRWQAALRETREAAEIAPAGGRYVKAGDVDVFIQEAGPRNGTVVLLMHGTGAWSETWRESMQTLADAGFHAVALDLPPFGLSARPATARYAKADQARRIIGVLDALDAREAILVGHSFGGGPTVEATLLAPQRVKGLVLVDAALAIADDQAAAERPGILTRTLLQTPPVRDALVATFLTNPAFTRRLLQAFIDDPARATDERVAVYQQPLKVRGTTHAVGEWLPELLDPRAASASESPVSYRTLTMPIVAIWGARDTITPLPQGERLVRLAPGARLVVIPDVGHIPQIENPEGFQRALREAVRSVGEVAERRGRARDVRPSKPPP
jgi:pimeloyl-ACP methyl ester carboxylesterase